MFKLIVAGSRHFRDFDVSNEVLTKLVDEIPGKIQFVSGGAKGADQAPVVFMDTRRTPRVFLKFFPVTNEDWERNPYTAGHMRNKDMARYADGLITFWDGKSGGTRNMIEQMENLGKPWMIFGFDGKKIK